MARGQAVGWLILMMWVLVILGAISFVIATTLGTLFASKQDVRHAESSILAEKLIGCVAGSGIMDANFDLKNCYAESQDIYASANLISIESNFSRFVESGNRDINLFCNLQDQGQEQKAAKCFSQRYYVLIKNDSRLERGLLELTAGIEKYDKNI